MENEHFCPKRAEISKREYLNQPWKRNETFNLKKAKMKKFKLGETYRELIGKCGGIKEAEINV